jgi:hypothetical protein
MSEWKFRGKRQGCGLRTPRSDKKSLEDEHAVGILLLCFKSHDVNRVCKYLCIEIFVWKYLQYKYNIKSICKAAISR